MIKQSQIGDNKALKSKEDRKSACKDQSEKVKKK